MHRYLNHNNMDGMIPKEITQMISLKHLRLEENEFSNTVQNVGPIEVYSDQTHKDLTEQWTERWNIGPHFPRDGDEFLRWKKGRQAEKAAIEAKWTKGHMDKLQNAAKAITDAVSASKPKTPGGTHPFNSEPPDATKGSELMGSVVKEKPGQIGDQIGKVPSTDGHFL